ncbi:MAG TPA: hypothetical protein PK095_17310 [Myxococcota bacterium]|nr:hypothetical protein [Myxococcota bacterium]
MLSSAPTLLRRIAMTVAPSALGVAFALALSGDAHAADQWKDKGKECDQTVFKDPGGASLSDLSKCSKAWAAYRTDYKGVKGDYKDRVVMAMKLLYAKGDEGDAERSQEILSRLGVTDLPSRSGAKAGAGNSGGAKAAAKPTRKTFDPPEPDKKAIAAAEKHFKAGFAAYGKKDWAKAAAAYEKMIEVAPGYAKGHFNAACIYSLQKDEKKMANALMNLRDMTGSKSKVVAEKAKEMLEFVKKDEDFKETRYESAEYKRIMGFAKVKVINHLGEKGEENIDNLMGSMKGLGYESAMKESDKKVSKFPIIYFTDHSKNQAYLIKQLIEHPKLETKYLDKEKLCSDDGCYDVVVQWNDDVKGDPKKHVADPKDAEKKIEDLEAKQDEMLRKPDEVLDEVDDALSKPDEVTDKVEELTDKPGKAVEKVEKTIDKIKGKF